MKKIWVLLVVATMMVVSVGCGSKTETPEQAVTNFMEALIKVDQETLAKYSDSTETLENDVTQTSEEAAQLLFGALSYKILSSKQEADNATVDIEITAIDMNVVVGEYMQKGLEKIFSGEEISDEQASVMLKEALENNKDTKVTNSCQLQLTKSEDSWKITVDDTFRNAIMPLDLGNMPVGAN